MSPTPFIGVPFLFRSMCAMVDPTGLAPVVKKIGG